MKNQLMMKNEIIRKYMKVRITNQQNFYAHPSYHLEQVLLRAITRGELEQAKLTLDEINQLERAKLASNTVRSLKNSLICSCTLFTRAIIKGGVHPESAYNLSDVFIQQIEETHDPTHLSMLEYEMLDSFIEALKEEKQESYQYVVNKAISYISKEILNDLTLERIAEEVKVHPSYLSKVFKAEVSLPLTEFINRRKVEESKFFLLHGNTSISDIALLFRFCNQSYYTSLFKKYTGVTPKMYRDRYAGISNPED